jgi:hypothetical protein
MAAGKPIVSTGINDVKSMFSDVVRIAADGAGFVEGCRAVLDEKGAQRTDRLADMQACVWRYSWSKTVQAVHRAIEDELSARPVLSRQPAGIEASALTSPANRSHRRTAAGIA